MSVSVSLSPSPILQFFNNSGQPNAGGSVLTQVGGINYPTYQDPNGNTPLPNPIPLNSRGEVSNASGVSSQLFLEVGQTYAYTLYDADGNQLDQANYVTPPIPANSSATSNITYNEGGSGAVTRTLLSRLQDYVSVKDFGATGNGVTDDTTAIQNAINSLGTNGGILYFPPGNYLVSSTINVGNGTNSSISSKTGIYLIGSAGGVGPGEFSSPLYGTQITWNGTTSTANSVIQFNGPLHSCGMENFYIDCNSKAGTGLNLQHPYQCQFRNINVDRYTYRGWIFVSRTQSISGVTQGAMDNTFANCFARDPASAAVETGFYMDGNDANNIGCSRNVFTNCTFLIAGNAGTRGMYIGYVDNCVFIRVSTLWATATQLGAGVYEQGSTTHPGFPLENVWLGCALQGGATQSGTTGNNLMVGYSLSDAEPLPTWDAKNKSIFIDGRMWGGFSGSANMLCGSASPGSGLNTSGTNYFPISGEGDSGISSTQNVAVVMPVGGKIVRFRTYLATAPGVGIQRQFTLIKNGSATSAVITYGAAQSGDSAYTLDTGISFNGGDLIEVRSQAIGGAAASSQCSFSMMYYPTEVI